MPLYLCADLGGTNANVALVDWKKNKPVVVFDTHEKIKNVKNSTHFFTDFLSKAKLKKLPHPRGASIAVAGKIEKQRVHMTNTNLVIDVKVLQKKLKIKEIKLINDFEALAYSVNVLTPKDQKIIQKGSPGKNGIKVVIGAGTGLGKAIVLFDKSRNIYAPLPSEGGHTNFPSESMEEVELMFFLKNKLQKDIISYEDLLSGKGLENIYVYLQQKYFENSKTNLSAEEISYTKKNNPASRKTWELFVQIYARCARNFALDALATGGVYIAGGIATKNAELFNQQFVSVFNSHPVFANVLKNIPLVLITNYEISLQGAAYALSTTTFKKARS